MSGSSKIYLQFENSIDEDKILRRFPMARSFTDYKYYAVEYDFEDDGKSIEKFIKISKDLNLNLIGMGWHSSMDWFAYFNIEKGELKRHIVRGEAVWVVSDGIKEEWEDEVMFGDAETELGYVEDDFKNKHIEEKEYDRIKNIFEKKEIEAGSFFPMLTAYEAAEAVSLKYRLPDWLEAMENGYIVEDDEGEYEEIVEKEKKKWWQFWK